MIELKERLYLLCNDYIANQVATIKRNVADAQEAASDDTKSSSGDKYEVGREMMQQEIELNYGRLGEMLKLKQSLENINPSHKNVTVSPGSLIYTSNGVYFIAIGAGKLSYEGKTYYAISSEAPIAQQMNGKKSGDEFAFNGKTVKIEKIF